MANLQDKLEAEIRSLLALQMTDHKRFRANLRNFAASFISLDEWERRAVRAAIAQRINYLESDPQGQGEIDTLKSAKEKITL
jgi:hypothetical protein